MLIYLAASRRPAPPHGATTPDCDIQRGPCIQSLAGGTASLDISPRPVRAMTDLAFRLTIDPPPASGEAFGDSPFIDLDMPDMFMGYNRITMTRELPGVYSGAGVIVRCPSGIPTWKARVTVPGLGEAVFVFDVLY
ncbi:hypothetical protein [Desulfococcus sp.]|uniref:hypothetical protein n=1 Tax=Desulfococcus sp. TaxID=2025834 RepID=UPI00359487FE